MMTTVYPVSPVQMERRCPIIGCLCFLLFAILGIVSILTGFVLYDQFDQLFGDTVRQQMEINDDVFWWYQRWLEPPVHQTLTVHVFQVENSAELQENWLLTINETYIKSVLRSQQEALNKQRQQEILRRLPIGSRRQIQILPVSTTIKPMVERSVQPRVREIGPFVFRIEQWKEQVNFTDQTKQQLSYEQRTRYHFEPLLSYEDLEHKVIVANAELSALNPFMRLMLKRAQSVARISQALRLNIEQILQLYALNMFVERTIGQVIFGTKFENEQQQPEEGVGGGGGEKEELAGTLIFIGNKTKNDENNNIGLNRNNRLVKSLTQDVTINRILTLYDRIEPYLKRLGVNLNPYQLLTGAYKYEMDARRGLRLVDVRYKDNTTINSNRTPGRKSRPSRLTGAKSESVDYRDNFVWSFFTNDSREKYDIFTGVETNRNGEIIRWNQQTFMDDWFARWCNTINGTDGRQYRPFLRSPRIYSFIPRICRSLPMKLSDLNVQATPSGIRLRRYTRADDFMQSPYKNKNNGCYCRFGKQPKRCNYDGILDLANCYHGAPIILTNPHFSGKITRSIGQSIDGLTPDDAIYQTLIDVEPVSGIVLDKVERFQFNVHLQPMPLKINSTHYLPELIVPLMWYQERLQASKEYQQSIKYLFVYPMRYQEYGVIALILLGMFLAFIGIISAFVCCCTHKPVKTRILNSVKAMPQPITVQTSTPTKLNPNASQKQPPNITITNTNQDLVSNKSNETWAEPKPPILEQTDFKAEKPFNQNPQQIDEEIRQLFPDDLLKRPLFANVDANQNSNSRPNGSRIMKYGFTPVIYPKQPVIQLATTAIPTIVQQIPVTVVEIDENYSKPEEEGGDPHSPPISESMAAPTAPLPPEPKPLKLKRLSMIKTNLLGKLKKPPQPTSVTATPAAVVTPIETIRSQTTWANQKPNQQLSISELFPPTNIDETSILEHVLDDDDDDTERQFPEDNIYEETTDLRDQLTPPMQDKNENFTPRDYYDYEDDDDDDDDDEGEEVDGEKKQPIQDGPLEDSETVGGDIESEQPIPVQSTGSKDHWLTAKKVLEETQQQRIYLSRPGWPTRRDLIDDLPQRSLRMKLSDLFK